MGLLTRLIIPSFPLSASAAAATRAPTARWNVHFADSQCIAHRDYGTAEAPVRLLLKAPAVGDVMQVAVLRPAARTSPEQVEATVTLDLGPPLKTNLLTYTPRNSKERIYLLNMPAPQFAAVRRARTLSVRSSGLNETFELSQMEPLLKVVDECVADLRRVFNIGANGSGAEHLTSRARANLAKLFSDQDYPAVAVMEGQSGRVGFALLIGEDGRVADCTIVATSGVPSLDSQACALLQARAKFEPARDMDGKPAKDSAVGGIVWRIPE